LYVVGLLKTVSACRHDARLFIGEIDLIGIAYARFRRFGLGSSWRFAFRLGCFSFGSLGFIFGLLGGLSFRCPRLNLRLAAAIAFNRSSRRASSAGMPMPSGTSASAASAIAISRATSPSYPRF